MTHEPARPASRPQTWLTIQEASDLIGVSQATLRRWTESGDVEAFVTPGGHRRFARTAILGLLPAARPKHRTLRELGETPEHIVRQYRRELASSRGAGWLPVLDEPDKELFRERGRQILAGVLAFLDAPTPAEGELELAKATEAAVDYGRLAGRRGFAIAETTAAFLRFRAPFLEELATIARRRRLDASEAISLIIAAASVFDRLLLALLAGHVEPSAEAIAARTFA